MAEVKTRILLRSDILANWIEHDPVLLKGELSICYDPAVTGDRKIRIKVGDGVSSWSALPYVADYDAIIAEVQGDISALEGDISALEQKLLNYYTKSEVDAKLVKKVDMELVGDNGKSYIFNEKDGGGAKFVNNDGVESFVGVNDGGESGLAAQIYADKLVNGKWQGAKIDVTNGGIYYTVGDESFAERAIPENEIAVKGDVESKAEKSYVDTKLAEKVDKVADARLMTDAEGAKLADIEEGAQVNKLEEVKLSGNFLEIKHDVEGHGPYVDLGNIATSGAIEAEAARAMAAEAALSDRLDNVYTKSEVYTKTETETKIADAIAGIKHWTYKVVDVLPTPSKDCEHIIYLVPKGSGKTGYKEYVCINEGTEEVPVWKFEEIGDTDIDLSEYRKAADQDEIDTEIKGLITAEAERAAAAEDALDTRVTDLEDDSHTHSNKTELDLIASGDVAKWNAKQDAITVGDGLKFENNKVELDFTILDGGSASDWQD